MRYLVLCALLAVTNGVCQYGKEPGVWNRTEWGTVPSRGTTLDYFRLDDTKESVWLETSVEPPEGFGSAWQTLSTDCQLENVLLRYLGSPTMLDRNITIVLIGDSNDEHILDFLCMAYHSRHGYAHWRAYVHSHKTINYCILDSGLAVVQLYSMSLVEEDERGIVRSLRFFFDKDDKEAYTRFDGFPGTNHTLIGRNEDVRRIWDRTPDLVVCSNTYWALNGFVSRDETAKVVHPGYLSEFTSAMHVLLGSVREAFPTSKLGMRTSHQVRSNCEDGDTTRRAWGKRMWVNQINHAKRSVVRTERRQGHAIELFDVELMASGFTPTQSTQDDIHFKGWLGLELLNVYLNKAVG